MSRFSDRSVRELYAQAGSTAAVPGGGVVTALSAMLGVALVQKAVHMTLRHQEHAELHAAAPVLDELASAFEADAEADAAAFADFIAAGQLPKTTPDETAARRARLDHAAAGAAHAALGALQHARAAVRVTRRIRPLVTATMAPDITAGLRLLHVARRNAIDNARGNLEAMSPGAEQTRLLELLRRLAA